MTITFEKGPWKIDVDSVGALHEGCAEISAESGKHFALATVAVVLDGDPHCRGSETMRGNARLIAKAPEMFDLLSRLQEHVEELDGASSKTRKLQDDMEAFFAYMHTDVMLLPVEE